MTCTINAQANGPCPEYSFNSANNQITNTGYTYNAAGDMTYDNVNTYTYNAENEMTAAGSSTYKYDGEGRQVNNSAGTLFWYGQSGQVLAELQGGSNWSDYIYANGRRIAKADNFEYRIHIYGNNCSNCGNQYSGYAFLGPDGYGGYYNYVIQSGDQLCWRQWESGGVGGIMMIFNDNTNTNWVTYDQDGQLMNTDGIQGSWHYRRVDLSAYAGKSLQSINLLQQGGATGGPWDMYFQDVTLVSADGTVRPLYNRETSISLNPWVTSGVSNWGYAIDYHTVNDPTSPDDTTNYYQADAVGSERMMTSVDGYPVWQAMYAPYGDEVSPQMTVNDYKFAGLTRDPVTGLDHAMLRTYSSGINRWMTPDRLGGDITNPQSLNRYAYALNNPTTLTDPSGLGPNDCGPTSICITVPINPPFSPPTLGGGIGECPFSGCTPNCSIFVCGAAPWNNGGSGGGTIFVTSYGTSGGGSASAPNPAPPSLISPSSQTPPCSVGNVSTSFGQYFSGVASAATMFGEFLSGSGPDNLTFGPQSVESQLMSSSPGVAGAVTKYLSGGGPTGLYTFGLGGLGNAGVNPIRQFVGSYTWSVVPTNGGLNVTLSNYTSFHSGTYHLLPSHQRSTFGPTGTTHQTYEVFVPCHS